MPRKDLNSVKITDTGDDVVPVIFASGHTRLHVTQTGNVVGILHTKEFLAFRETGSKDWQSIIRPALKVLPTDSVLTTLRLIQTKRNHMAIVIAPTGLLLGMVTLEDIFDEDDDSRIRKVFADRVKRKMQPPHL